MQDQWSTGYVQIPVLLGMELPQWYWQAGVKFGLNAYAKSSISTTLTTSVSDQELIDDLVNMDAHYLGTSAYEMASPIALKLNPNLALAAEIGIKLDKWLQPTVKRGRRMTPMQKLASSMHYQLALFAEYGVMNIYNPILAKDHTNAIPADFSAVLGKPADTPLAYTSSLQTSSAAGAKLNPFMVGVKLAVMCDLPRKEKRMLPMPVEPKPRMVTKVINAETGLALGGVQMSVENTQTGAVYNSTSNSKGVMMARFSKADYRISASKLGFMPCDTITWSHMADLSDTIHFALVPEPKPIVYTLCGYVRNRETTEPLAAEVSVVALKDEEPLYKGASNEEGLFISQLLAGQYRLSVGHVGFIPLDTVVTFEQDTLHFQLQPIKQGIKVKIDRLYFATNKTVILPESEGALNSLANFLKENPSVSICIIGHTDNVGSDADNMRLSQGRSQAVRNDLIQRGIDASRLEAIGKGETMPVATNDTEEGRAQNRRVEFEITDTQGDDIQQIYE
jgi:outer membrane protein OmpA-like peptidoglycan-associated protein